MGRQPERPGSLPQHHNEQLLPRGDRARRVPISGAEERALLGLLERWASQDSDAKELEQRYGLYEHGEIDIETFRGGFPERQRLKGMAVSILRPIRARN